MADSTTVKRVKLQIIDEFSRPLDKYKRGVGEAGRATDDLGKRGGLRQLNQDLGALAIKAGVAFGALAGAAKGADALSQVGQQALRSRAALETLTTSASDYEAKVRAVQVATRGLTTESEAAAIAARLQQFGLAESAREMQGFVDTVVRVGAVNPMLGDTSEAINQIQLTLSNMSFMRLDQLGLSAGAVRKRMAELKEETAGLSTEAAFQQAVMEALAEQAGRVSDETLNIGNAQGRAKTRLREWKDELGIFTNDTLETALTSLEQLSTLITQLGLSETIIRVGIEVVESKEFEGMLVDFVNAVAGPTFGMQVGEGEPMMTRRVVRPGMMDVDAARARQATTFFQQTGFSTSQASMRDAALIDPASGLRFNPATLAGRTMRQRDFMPPPRTVNLGGQFRGAGQDFLFQASQNLDVVGGQFNQNMAQLNQTILPGILSGVGAIGDKFAEATGAATDFTNALPVQSLNELFGVAPAGLDADMYSRASDSLRGANVEGELLADTLRVLGLETGTTTAANELYNARLDDLAQSLASGTITMDQYIAQWRELQNFDFSRIQMVADSLDPERAAAFIESLSAPGGQESFDKVVEGAQTFFETLGVLGEGGGEGDDLGPFGAIATQADNLEASMVDANKRMTDDAAATWGSVSESGTAAFQEINKESERAFDEMRATLESMNFTVDVRTRLASANSPLATPLINGGPGETARIRDEFSQREPGSGEAVRSFHEGGYTGDDPREFMALLRGREMVVPLDGAGRGGAPMMPNLSSRADRNQPIVIQSDLYLDGEVVARSQKRIDYRTNSGGRVRD